MKRIIVWSTSVFMVVFNSILVYKRIISVSVLKLNGNGARYTAAYAAMKFNAGIAGIVNSNPVITSVGFIV